jgi:uncharacterized protein (DUF1778 family)
MALDSSPVCFRVSADERELLEAAAARIGKPLSAFMRYAGLTIAQDIANQSGGMDAFRAWYEDVRQLGAQYDTPQPIRSRTSPPPRQDQASS